jgi:hypothetical protein
MSGLKSKPPSKRKRKTDKPGPKEDFSLFDEEPPNKLRKRSKVARKSNLQQKNEQSDKLSEKSSKF